MYLKINGIRKKNVRAWYWDQEKDVNNTTNNFIEKLTSLDNDNPQKDVITALLDDQHQIKCDLLWKVGSSLDMKTAKKWFNEG